jgi:hypothetical protein
MPRKLFFILIMVLALLIGCSDNPPEIIRVSWQVILFNDRESGLRYQKLSLFVQVKDEDGVKDIGALYLIQDDAELFWKLNEDTWELVNKGSETWIGSNALSMPKGEAIPTGKYRIFLEDLSGQNDVTFLNINNDNVNTTQAKIPEAYINGDKIFIQGIYDLYELWVYDKNNRFFTAFPIDKNGLKTEVITTKDETLKDGFSYYVYCTVKNNLFGILNGPYYFTPSEESVE